MWLQIIILLCAGFVEELINILYYSMCYAKLKYATGIFQMLRVFIWYYVLKTIVTHIDNLWLILFYALGGCIGDYCSLTIEPYLEKKILWVHKIFKKKRGRRKKAWYKTQAKKVKK